MHEAGAAADRTVIVVAESSDNDPCVVRPDEEGGYGFDAVWDDDVHHSIRVALTDDRRLYYCEYAGAADVATVLAERWLFGGRYSAWRGRTHGRAAGELPFERFVVFTSNDDHVGNTPAGARPPATTTGPSASWPWKPVPCRRSRRCCSWARSTPSRRRSRSSSTTATRSC